MDERTRVQIVMDEGFDELFGKCGMVYTDHRDHPKFKLPVLRINKPTELELLVCGRALYGMVLEVLTELVDEREYEGVGFRVRIVREGEGIHMRYKVTYLPVPVTVLQGWTWRGLVLAALGGICVGAAIMQFLG